MDKRKKIYIGILIILIFVFLIGYEIYKGKIRFTIINNNSIVKNIYYCEDSSYQLNSSSCSKYIAQLPLLLGDVNKDNIVDINDINDINSYIKMQKNLNNFELAAADVNNDTQVDINDISLLQNYLLGTNSDIGKKYVCDNNYFLEDNLCKKKITVEAIKLDYKVGDINQDSKVNVIDKILLEKYLSNSAYLSEISFKIADINNDNVVDSDDLALIKDKINDDTKITYKEQNYTKVNITQNLSLQYWTSTENSEVPINTIIDYHIVFNTKNNYYYQFLNISNDHVNGLSMCKKIDNFENNFQITVIGNNNYGQINFYSDAECRDEVATYETTRYKQYSNQTE